MKIKTVAVMAAFFYVSWYVERDPLKDYTGKTENVYGVMHSTITLVRPTDNGGYLAYDGRSFARHRTIETVDGLKNFLRKAPNEVDHIDVLEIRDGDREFYQDHR